MSETGHFLERLIQKEISQGTLKRLVTRFPPEPNGCLHLGHAKSMCLNFGLVEKFGGVCTLRLDDSNPITGDENHIESIKEDVRWLGFDWGSNLRHASDYFDQLIDLAFKLIDKGKAYVDDQSLEEIRTMRGTLKTPGQESPFRNRDVAENRALFERMCQGDFAQSQCVLRAKIDMSSGNMHLRDPILYRIRHTPHPRTLNQHCVYPMYDFAHTLSDAIEGVTHSLCTLEFEDHRALYDWLLQQLSFNCPPRQFEFSRMSMGYTVMSKRHLIKLIEAKVVSGWDDPRMPTLKGLRRRGIPAAAIKDMMRRIGLTKDSQMVESALLDFCTRAQLEESTPRAFCVLRPLKVVITTLSDQEHMTRKAPLNPKKPDDGTRYLTLEREIYIERDDFRLDAPSSFKRLKPGALVRLRYACVIRCDEVLYNDQGEVAELRCSHDPDSFGGQKSLWGKPKGIIHWLGANTSCKAEIRLYEPLFTLVDPLAGGNDPAECVNPNSQIKLNDAHIEASLQQCVAGSRYQFERLGYFFADPVEHIKGEKAVFNRIATLKDSFQPKHFS